MHKSKLTSSPEMATDSEIITIQKQDKSYTRKQEC